MRHHTAFPKGPTVMTARYSGKCRTCGGAIEAGSEIVFCGHKDSHHRACWTNPVNSPAAGEPTVEPMALDPEPRVAATRLPVRGEIVSVRTVPGDGCEVRSTDNSLVFVPALKRRDLWAVAEAAFPEVKGTYWRKATNDMIRESLAYGAPCDAVQAWMRNDALMPSGNGASDIKVSEVKVVAASFDEKRAREVAREEAQAVLRVARTIEIRVGDEPVRKLEGLHHKVLQDVLDAVAERLHVYLYGPAGTGKSTIAASVAKALDLDWSFEAFSPDKDATSLIGYRDAHGAYHGTEFQRLYQNGGVFLADEIDNCDPSILAVLNAALANGHMVFPGLGKVARHADFVFIAAGNTWGNGPDATFIGRTELDAATLDRFVSVHVPIDEDLEMAVALSMHSDAAVVERWVSTVRRIRARVEETGTRLVVSPRAVFNGLKLLRRGWSEDKVLTSVVYRGSNAETRRSLS